MVKSPDASSFTRINLLTSDRLAIQAGTLKIIILIEIKTEILCPVSIRLMGALHQSFVTHFD